MNAEGIIAARRQHIQDNAKCDGCGGTLIQCKAERGKDPTAPDWFGCCARGVGLDRPCSHTADPGELLRLLAEIESGTVRTVEEVAAASRPAKTAVSWFEYLSQGEKWRPNGKPMVAIADMDPEWRHNAARFLERRAAVIGQRYALAQNLWLAAETASPLGPSETSADAIEREIGHEQDLIAADPVAWLRSTALHKALVAGLPAEPEKLAELAERAKHWAACPARTGGGDCRCDQIRLATEHLSECALRNGTPDAGCTCRDNSPEWTTS